MKNLLRSVGICTVSLLTGSAFAQDMQGVSWTGAFSTVDLTSGVVTTVGMTGFDRLNAQAVAPDGRTYSISNQSTDGQLIEIDVNTGNGTLIANLGDDLDDVRGLAWNSMGSNLYAIARSPNAVHTIDPATGSSTLIGSLSIGFVQAAATSPSGVLYAWNAFGALSQGGLYEIDTMDGTATHILPNAAIYNWMSFDSSGVLYGGTNGSGDLNIIDPVAGTVTPVVPGYSGADFRGLDFIPDPLIGTPFCDPANANSTSMPVLIAGSMTAPGGSGLHLEASQGPPNEFGYFLIGTATVDPGLTISDGILCLTTTGGNALGRYNVQGTGFNSLGQFDATGVLQNLTGTSSVGSGFDVPTAVPVPGSLSITAGSTWHFQLWYRDTPSSPGVSNLSNGLSVTF